MHFDGTVYCVVLVVMVSACAGERWRWPKGAESVRIDTKVRFVDDDASGNKHQSVQADEPPFVEASNTDGFYNRPQGSGRYPVKVEHAQEVEPYRVNKGVYVTHNRPQDVFNNGELPLQYCKCVPTPECQQHTNLPNICGSGKFLCCYRQKRPNKNEKINSEFFNEVEDERLTLLPGKDRVNGPFPPPPNNFAHSDFSSQGNTGNIGHPQKRPILVGPKGPTGMIGTGEKDRGVLVGPAGPSGITGPDGNDREILIGPSGPTGIIGPGTKNEEVLVGPKGPTGLIGPPRRDQLKPTEDTGSSESAQRGVLVGPGGPTGIIGPGYNQRPVLVGPGGPTGIIGPGRTGPNQGVLVGPGGPTGIVGPYGYYQRHNTQPGLLVGPGGPTGTIGPGRPLLIGPGGPTGVIGPRRPNYFGK